MTRVVVLGGTGYAGAHIAREAVVRGLEVTSWSRSLPESQVDGVALGRLGSPPRPTRRRRWARAPQAGQARGRRRDPGRGSRSNAA